MKDTLTADRLFGGGFASPFFSPGFLKALKVAFGPLTRTGAVHTVVRRRMGFLHIQALPYGHPGIPPDAPEIHLDAWMTEIPGRIGRMEVVDRFRRARGTPFRSVLLHETLILLDAPWETVERRMRKSLREQVRQSLRKGVNIRPLPEEDLPRFFALVEATHRRRHGVVPPPRSLLEALWKHAREELVALGAYVNGRLVSGLWILQSPDEWFAYLQGTDPAFYAYRVSPRIFYEAIRMAHARGVRIFSMGVTPPGKERLVFFKESLGGRPYRYPLWVYEHPVYGGLRRLYRRWKRWTGGAEIEVEG